MLIHYLIIMMFFEKNITFQDFLSLDINSVIDPNTTYNSQTLEQLLSTNQQSDAMLTLSAICSMLLEPGEKNNPYKARMNFGDRRTLIPSDFSEAIFKSLKEFCPEINSPLLKSKVLDLIWVTKNGGIDFAINAIENLKIAATELLATEDISNIHEGVKLFERALRLSASLRRNQTVGKLHLSIITKIQNDFLETNERFYQTINLIEILIDISPDDIDQSLIYNILKKMIKVSNRSKKYLTSERIYLCLLQLSRHNKDKVSEYKVYNKIAKCFFKEAKQRNHGFVSAGFIKNAIEYLEKAPDTRKKRKKLYELMREYQREGMLHGFTIPIESVDLSKPDKSAREFVQGKDLFDTLMRFSIVSPPSDIEKLRENARQQMDGSLSNIFNSNHYDHDGLPVAEVQADQPENNEKIEEKTVQLLAIEHQLLIKGCTYPALMEITERYHLSEHYFYELFRNNTFIPPDHIGFFAKGINAGFNGDFLTAMHLLIPQIENSLRYILSLSGEEPTTLFGDGDQERKNLKNLLDNPIIQKALTQNIISNLKIIMLDKIYGDHRNQVSHGYMPTYYYYNYSSIYIWWFVFHILMSSNYKKWNNKYCLNGI